MENESLIPVADDKEHRLKPKKSEKKSGNRLGFNYIIIKSLKQSQKNDVVKCFYMKSPLDFGYCVIKEGSYNELKDKYNRDIIDRLKWQQFLHKTLQGKMKVPKFIGSFEENGNYYLAIDYIGGRSFGAILRKYNLKVRPAVLKRDALGKKVLNYLIQIIGILDKLHGFGIVHRDASSANFVVNRLGKVTLIDLELSYSISLKSPEPPFQLGTNGYMSPEQMAVHLPTIKEDIFAVGAIILQTFTGLNPAKLVEVGPEELNEKIDFLIPELAISDIVKRCLAEIPGERPDLSEVQRVLKSYASARPISQFKGTDRTKYISTDILRETIQNTINSLGSPLFSDSEKGWFSDDTSKKDMRDKSKITKAWYASVHVGAAGIMSFLEKAYKTGLDINCVRGPMDAGLTLIYDRYIVTKKKQPGLLFGSDGIASTLSKCFNTGLFSVEPQHGEWIDQLFIHECESQDLLTGKSGQLLANIISADCLQDEKYIHRTKGLVSNLLLGRTVEGYWADERQSVSNRSKSRIGFSLGTAGITYALIEYSYRFNDGAAFEVTEKSLRWIMKNSISSRGKLTWLSRKGMELPPTLSEGVPGICLPLISAFKMSGEKKYRMFAERALESIPDEVFYSNLGQWDGLSGLGEVYLEAFKIFGQERWLDRAHWISQLLLRMKQKHVKHGTYWQVESEKQPLAGLMNGNVGVLNFLLRLSCNGDLPPSWM